MSKRPTVDRYFMDMTHLVKSRGTCPRRQVGAVIVKDKHVLTTGYNGAPKGFTHPTDVGCIRDELGIKSGDMADVCPCLHAEQNAIIQAATFGVSVSGADIYCTTQPCTQCSRMIANSGIGRVIFHEEYPDRLAIGLLTSAGVELWHWDDSSGTARRYDKVNTWEEAQDELRKEHGVAPKGNGAARTEDAGVRRGSEPVTSAAGAQPTAVDAAEETGPPVPTTGPATARDPAQVSGSAGDAESEEALAARIRDIKDDPERERIIQKMLAEREKRMAEVAARSAPESPRNEES